jgi:hypothetical protein
MKIVPFFLHLLKLKTEFLETPRTKVDPHVLHANFA